ncbi:hypothetical protein [Hyphomicrobium sp. DY-1]|uniref:hypothetical protein n=1 Tax=Hyphomicrobium sp. DY-1 TaxID=3075650 RepID=UPI0039C347B8
MSEAEMYGPMYWEIDRVIYKNRQWAVTSYGVENIAGPYHYFIEIERLDEDDWIEHMQGKKWVDIVEFSIVLGKAREIHRKGLG